MKQVYLLPCQCGLKVHVDKTQAGLSVKCECGRTLDVPTLRDLTQLEQVGDQNKASASKTSTGWGPRQGLTLVGVLITLVGLIWLAYQIATMPQDLFVEPADIRAEVNTLSPGDLIAQFRLLREKLDPTELSIVKANRIYQEWHRRWTYFAAGVTLLGLALAAGAWFTLGRPATRQGRPPR